MIFLIDYGAGNLRSVEKALRAVGADVVLTSNPDQIKDAKKLVLPGVGHFGDGMEGLRTRNLIEPIVESANNGIPLLGICLGMQLLFDESAEAPGTPGLGLISGEVYPFQGNSVKVPQIGWNQVVPIRSSRLLEGIEPGSYAYFNHGYYCKPSVLNNILATTNYEIEYASVVKKGNLYGVQYHPEKSQNVGLTILRNFVYADME
jgi:glutamine amidotransferase